MNKTKKKNANKIIQVINLTQAVLMVVIFIIVLVMLITNTWRLLWKWPAGIFVVMIILSVFKDVVTRIINLINREPQYEPPGKPRD